MKKLLLSILFYLSYVATNAQITAYNNAAQNTFYGIGGYSFSQQYFTGAIRPNPDVVTGPSPQNDFTYTVSADGGIQHVYSYISTLSVNKTISIEFKSNNVRKFGCKTTAVNIPTGIATSEDIIFTAYTNQGNSTATGSLTNFVGFNITGNENDYITLITATFANPSSNSIAINSIIVGDNNPQNTSLNFDGFDDYVSIPSNAGNNTGNFASFTVTCWIKPDATQPSSAINPSENDILSKWAGLDAGINNNYPFVVRYLNTTRTNVNERGKILVGIWDGTNFPLIISNTAVNDGKWHHVAFVKTNTTNTLTLYIDGLLNGSTTNTITSTTINSTPLQIGRRGNGQNYFRGDIDEVRIWSTNKTQATIQAEMFCKNPNTNSLQAAYNFSNGVPHDNNPLITHVQDASSSANHGTLINFAKTGDASNFITGQVKYVSGAFIGGNNGNSWANGFDLLQSALSNNTCNDLFDIYVAKGFTDYKPSTNGNASEFFNIPSGMRIYGGFAGTEKSINHRNMVLIHSTNKTTLSGDLFNDDTPFNFSSNRTDNSNLVVQINGSNTVFDGFTVRSSKSTSSGLFSAGSNITIRNNRFIDNSFRGIAILGDNNSVINCFVLGNGTNGIYIQEANTNLNNTIIANNGASGMFIYNQTGDYQASFTNCTITANGNLGINASTSTDKTLTIFIKNSIIHNNTGGVENTGVGNLTNFISYSLVQGVATGTGNLDGNTTNPQFVSPLANTVRSDVGDYRLKWCSKAIGAGTNSEVNPLDLDRNPRNFNGTTDMGAYEFLGNTPAQVDKIIITGTIDMPIYAGGTIQTITSTAKILAPAGKIDFKAPNAITLNPGFEARGMSSYFKAEIGANVGCVN